MTGYVIADLLLDSDWCGAQSRSVIGSASSKTGFSAAAFMCAAAGYEGAMVGLTSEQHVASSLRGSGCYDSCGPLRRAGSAGASSQRPISTSPATWACGPGYIATLTDSCGAGRCWWARRTGISLAKSADGSDALPGSEPEVFFAPAQIEKRDAEWGGGAMMGKAYAASISAGAASWRRRLAMESHAGARGVRRDVAGACWRIRSRASAASCMTLRRGGSEPARVRPLQA